MQPNTRCQEKKESNWSPRACWSLVSAAHSLCLGRDSGGLKDFAGKVRRCTFRWREQTAAFLFCHLTFWWGDVSPAARAGRRGKRSGVCRGMWSRGLFFFPSFSLKGGGAAVGASSGCTVRFQGGPRQSLEQRAGHSRRQQSVLARTLASLTLFTQSPRQLFPELPPSLTTNLDAALESTPPLAWCRFKNILFFFSSCFCLFLCHVLRWLRCPLFSECRWPAVGCRWLRGKCLLFCFKRRK